MRLALGVSENGILSSFRFRTGLDTFVSLDSTVVLRCAGICVNGF